MIDLHCHILPKVDDGAKTMEEAINMARIAELEGITTIVATPHYINDENYDPTINQLDEIIDKLNQELKNNEINVTILPGNEIYLTLETPLNLKDGKIKNINKTNYILVELPFNQYPKYIEDVLYELRIMGYIPILAHPERYQEFQKFPNKLKELVDKGLLCQMNTTSLVGFYGDLVQKTAEIMLKHNLIHCVGTDAHSERKRKPQMIQSYSYARNLIGEEKADCIFKENAMKIINNQNIDSFKTIEFKKQSVLNRIFNR